jgi:arylsulfatase A-like enzyme
VIPLLALLATVAVASPPPPQRPPNFLVILTDDLGYGDLGSYGNRKIKTPVLDRLAAGGIRLTSAYASAPLCSASRAAFLTGRESMRNGVGGVQNPTSKGGLAPEELTLARLLKGRGYATACIGKWHLGRIPPYLPMQHGFDLFFGLPYSNDMTPLLLMRGENIVERVDKAADRLPLVRQLTQRFTDEALRFVDENKARPFFLYLAHAMPHAPFGASAPFHRKSAGGPYGDVIEELDASVGTVLSELGRLGLLENTIVVFTSDNGAPKTVSNGGLRGRKFQYFEGGLRVPCIVSWPGHLAAPRVEDRAVSLMDFMPTFAALAGAVLPGDRTYDGRDLTGLLLRGEGRGDDKLFWPSAHRAGDWKLVLDKVNRKDAGQALLFNLRDDPDEAHDLAAENPALVARLRASLEEHLASGAHLLDR